VAADATKRAYNLDIVNAGQLPTRGTL